MTDVENALPNKAFVHTSNSEGLRFKCNMRALAHFIQPTVPTPALKYKVMGNSIANKIPLIVCVSHFPLCHWLGAHLSIGVGHGFLEVRAQPDIDHCQLQVDT